MRQRRRQDEGERDGRNGGETGAAFAQTREREESAESSEDVIIISSDVESADYEMTMSRKRSYLTDPGLF